MLIKLAMFNVQKWCESSLPAAGEDLHSELEAGEMDGLKEKSLNEKDLRVASPSVHANREEQKYPKKTDSSQNEKDSGKDPRKSNSSRSSESDPLESQEGKEHIPHPVSKPRESDKVHCYVEHMHTYIHYYVHFSHTSRKSGFSYRYV